MGVIIKRALVTGRAPGTQLGSAPGRRLGPAQQAAAAQVPGSRDCRWGEREFSDRVQERGTPGESAAWCGVLPGTQAAPLWLSGSLPQDQTLPASEVWGQRQAECRPVLLPLCRRKNRRPGEVQPLPRAQWPASSPDTRRLSSPRSCCGPPWLEVRRRWSTLPTGGRCESAVACGDTEHRTGHPSSEGQTWNKSRGPGAFRPDPHAPQPLPASPPRGDFREDVLLHPSSSSGVLQPIAFESHTVTHVPRLSDDPRSAAFSAWDVCVLCVCPRPLWLGAVINDFCEGHPQT